MRLNLFNAFNQQNFAPFNLYDKSTFVDQPALFGMPTAELSGRTVELQARFSFEQNLTGTHLTGTQEIVPDGSTRHN